MPPPDWPNINPREEVARLNSERRVRIYKSALALAEPRRIWSSGHLAFVASKPCIGARAASDFVAATSQQAIALLAKPPKSAAASSHEALASDMRL